MTWFNLNLQVSKTVSVALSSKQELMELCQHVTSRAHHGRHCSANLLERTLMLSRLILSLLILWVRKLLNVSRKQRRWVRFWALKMVSRCKTFLMMTWTSLIQFSTWTSCLCQTLL